MVQYLHFTFDDGPNIYSTPILLEILKNHNVQATFFMVGANLEPQNIHNIIRRLVRDGHTLGVHTYGHENLATISTEKILETITKTNDLIQTITGQKSYFVRNPFGSESQESKNIQKRLGFITGQSINWDIDSQDWQMENDHERVYKSTLAKIKSGRNGIVLMHEHVWTTIQMDRLLTEVKKIPDVKIVPLSHFLTAEQNQETCKKYECGTLENDQALYYQFCQSFHCLTNDKPNEKIDDKPSKNSKEPNESNEEHDSLADNLPNINSNHRTESPESINSVVEYNSFLENNLMTWCCIVVFIVIMMLLRMWKLIH